MAPAEEYALASLKMFRPTICNASSMFWNPTSYGLPIPPPCAPTRAVCSRLFLSVVIALFSHQVIGWPLCESMTSDFALNALLMAVWRRKHKTKVMVHSDQGSQFTSYDWQDFLKANNLLGNMSRRRNCHDNALSESFLR